MRLILDCSIRRVTRQNSVRVVQFQTYVRDGRESRDYLLQDARSYSMMARLLEEYRSGFETPIIEDCGILLPPCGSFEPVLLKNGGLQTI